MNEVKLTDFTSEQLQTLLEAVALRLIFDVSNKENLELWRVQILNAIGFVKRREETNIN